MMTIFIEFQCSGLATCGEAPEGKLAILPRQAFDLAPLKAKHPDDEVRSLPQAFMNITYEINTNASFHSMFCARTLPANLP